MVAAACRTRRTAPQKRGRRKLGLVESAAGRAEDLPLELVVVGELAGAGETERICERLGRLDHEDRVPEAVVADVLHWRDAARAGQAERIGVPAATDRMADAVVDVDLATDRVADAVVGAVIDRGGCRGVVAAELSQVLDRGERE